MKSYTYKGSSPKNHLALVTLGAQLGLQYIRKCPMGVKIAELANNGNPRAIDICKNNPQFFELI